MRKTDILFPQVTTHHFFIVPLKCEGDCKSTNTNVHSVWVESFNGTFQHSQRVSIFLSLRIIWTSMGMQHGGNDSEKEAELAMEFVGPSAKWKCRISCSKIILNVKMATMEHLTKYEAILSTGISMTAQITLPWSQPCQESNTLFSIITAMCFETDLVYVTAGFISCQLDLSLEK